MPGSPPSICILALFLLVDYAGGQVYPSLQWFALNPVWVYEHQSKIWRHKGLTHKPHEMGVFVRSFPAQSLVAVKAMIPRFFLLAVSGVFRLLSDFVVWSMPLWKFRQKYCFDNLLASLCKHLLNASRTKGSVPPANRQWNISNRSVAGQATAALAQCLFFFLKEF